MTKARLFHNGHSHQYHFDGGYISTDESLQPYKFEGKVLAAIEKIDNLRREDEPLGEGKDRTFGLDNYDIEARQYFAMAPMWDRVDPLAEKYYGISPYAYCGGDPVNKGDYNGMDWVSRTVDGVEEIYWDPDINGFRSCWEYNDNNGTSLTYIWDGTTRRINGKEYTFSNENKNVECEYGWDSSQILDFGDIIIFGNAKNATDARTLHNNLLFGTSYTGTNNPKSYAGDDTYDYVPRNPSEYPSIIHDLMYDAVANNTLGSPAFFDNSENVCKADLLLAWNNFVLLQTPGIKQTPGDKLRSIGAAILFGGIGIAKTIDRNLRKFIATSYIPE